MRRARLLTATLLFLLPVLTGCGAPSASPGAGAATPAGGGQQVMVTAKEWAVELKPATVKGGKVTFVVSNKGSLEHNFAVEGVGKIDLVLPGETQTLEATLQPGTYTIACDLSGHKEAGMTGKLTVSG